MKHIKTRVNTNTKAGKAAEGVAGFSVNDLQSILSGDQKLLQKLYEVRREGNMAAAIMPAIVETVGQKIQNEKEWNQFLGQFVKDGSNAEVAIQKAMNTASMSNAKFVHGMKEAEEAFKAEWELEKGRHKWSIDYNRAKFFVDLIVQDIDGKVKTLEQGSKLQQKQLKENEAFELKSAETIMEYGAEGLNTIHQRDYIEPLKKPAGILHRVRNALGL